ncbi:MAG: ABC transporter permease [Thermoleophilia bacterium]
MTDTNTDAMTDTNADTSAHRYTGPAGALRCGAADSAAVAGRYLRHYLRQPQLLVFSTVQPVMFVLLFRYVFGGAISTAALPSADYVSFLLPGILVQATTFGATNTAVGLAEDLRTGVMDRFRSLPMSRVAVLAGRTLSDLIRNTFVVLLMTGVGYLVGFRFQNGPAAAAGTIAVVVTFSYSLSWIYAVVGLAAKGAETAQAIGFVVTFPIVFASSVFVPIETFPGWLQGFARLSPITKVADASRGLALGDPLPVAEPVLWTMAWVGAILVIFVPLAIWRFRRGE